MADVAVCPRCNGDRANGGVPCRTCGGTGVVWRSPEHTQEAAVDAGTSDPTELRGV
jgi:DnaJ-class molecular chaperone